LGDRFEILSAAIAATVARIPLAHLHGGETTEGAFDESFRHSITKMSHLHFTSTEDYRDRVIQLGEQPDRVFNFGAPGIDNINRLNLLSRDAFEKSIGFKLGKRNLLVTFHPVTLEDATSEAQFSALLSSLDELEETHFVFTKANADTGGKIINQMIDGYASSHPTRSIAHASLGQLRYLSALQYVDGVIGNSSSGLLEVPSFKIGTINIGDRQLGRIRADSVIDCEPTPDQISSALEALFSPVFQSRLANVQNPYGGENIAEKIVGVIGLFPLDDILKKKFHDMGKTL
jgi:GDP/UDP-N,N'-diacetylbacillosamine 2-epimerase (hydrolysing)